MYDLLFGASPARPSVCPELRDVGFSVIEGGPVITGEGDVIDGCSGDACTSPTATDVTRLAVVAGPQKAS